MKYVRNGYVNAEIIDLVQVPLCKKQDLENGDVDGDKGHVARYICMLKG